MAAHSRILAWRILWTEDPGGLQSMASQRVGCNQSNLARTFFIQQIFIGRVSSILATELDLKPLMIKGLLMAAGTNTNRNLDKQISYIRRRLCQ